MIVMQNECVDCQLPCMYEGCPYYSVARYYCDECKEEVYDLWEFDNEELCQDCILNRLEKVE